MKTQIKVTCSILIKFMLWVMLLPLPTHAQDNPEIPRTGRGLPDFQGFWSNGSQTPIQRPPHLGEKRSYTNAEALTLQQSAERSDAEKAAPLDPNRSPPQDGGVILFQADENFANTRINITQIKGEYRTSLIVEPSDGRYPFVDNGENNDIFGQWREQGAGSFDGPEIRSQMERCLHVGAQMPPMMAWVYNANYQIVQTEDYMMLLSEMIHDVRIIPIGKERKSKVFPRWFGNSLGSWDGDIFVVKTTDFHPQQSNFFMKSSDQFEVVEYFELLSEDEIFYRYTVTDPNIYEEPFTIEMQIQRKNAGERIYEFACHEGNYSLPSILAGARRAEFDAQQTP